MLLQDVFQSFEAQSQKIEKHPGVKYAQSQQIEKHPGVTSGTLKVNRLKNILE
jgi:hypothetical protein